MKKVNAEFNEMYFKEIFPLISKSFLILSGEICGNQLNCSAAEETLEKINKEKANQIKEKINSFIDLQVEQNIEFLKVKHAHSHFGRNIKD